MTWEDKKIEGAEEKFTITIPLGVLNSKGVPKLVPISFKVWASNYEDAAEKFKVKFTT